MRLAIYLATLLGTVGFLAGRFMSEVIEDTAGDAAKELIEHALTCPKCRSALEAKREQNEAEQGGHQ